MRPIVQIRRLLAALLVCALAVSAGAQAPAKGKKGRKAKAAPAAAQAPAGLTPEMLQQFIKEQAGMKAPKSLQAKTTMPLEMIQASVQEQQALLANAPAPTIETTLAKMRAACDWQLDHLYGYPDKKTGKPDPKRNADTDWVRGAFFTGVMANYHATGDYRFYLAARKISESNKWQCGPRARHADDRTIAQTYLELYMLEGKKDPAMIQSIKLKYDGLMATEVPGRVDWWWCDALYMDPPTMARLAAATGEKKYLDYMNRMYWDATEYLYDKDEHFYYRDDRYAKRPDGTQALEKNGRKIFWSRGNGWVFGGLCRTMDYMPANYPARAKFEAHFKEMAGAVAKAQGKEGLWHSSLLDRETYPIGETSGSGFFVYGLAWGINRGLLDRAEYLPVVEKGWKALMRCVDDQSGKLQYVQFIGADPQLIKKEDNMEYGTGSFLLAGSEMLKLMAGEPKGKAAIEVNNPIELGRAAELVSVPWGELSKKAAGLLPSRVRLVDGSGAEVVTQVLYGDQGPAALVFQANFEPQEKKTFKLTLTDEPIQSVPESKAYCRYVPERLDDFAWENDRIAHRIYGQALQTPGIKDYLVSSGIDVWVKRVRTPVINKWFASGDYHTDNGEGLDNYKVDNSRGAGGIGIWAEDKLVCSENYKSWRVLANGPIVATFELTYAPWKVGDRTFSEVKTISLAAGSNMSHVVSRFTSDQDKPFKVGIGLNQTRGEARLFKDKKNGILSYWEDPDPKGSGSIATAVVVDPARLYDFTFINVPKATQNLALLKYDGPGQAVDYYAGAGWSKSGDFTDAAAWEKYLDQFVQRLAAPVKVSLN